MMKAQELEDRLVDFAVMVIGVVEVLPSSKAGNHIGGYMIRSGTSPASNYGEARSAESRRDFIHKMTLQRVWLFISPFIIGDSGRRQQGCLCESGSRSSAVQGGMPPDFEPSTLRLWTRSQRCRPWSLVDFFNKTCPGVSGDWGQNH